MADEEFSIEDIKNKIKDILSEPEIRFCGLIFYCCLKQKKKYFSIVDFIFYVHTKYLNNET